MTTTFSAVSGPLFPSLNCINTLFGILIHCVVVLTIRYNAAAFGTFIVALASLAQLVISPVAFTSAVRFRVAFVPFNNVPTFHIPVVELYIPCEDRYETNTSPVGKLSTTCTPDASFGPLLCAVTVNIIVLP